MSIVGGDTNASDFLVINIAVIGEASRRILTRSGAKVGDGIYVTGTLGDSALGFEALKSGKRKSFDFFVRKHITPPDRLKVGQRLAEMPTVHSAMDISDGLVGDLEHILEKSRVGAEINVDRIPCSQKIPVALKLGGGEDYELLFTASKMVPGTVAGVKVTRIGTILPRSSGLKVVDSMGREVALDKEKIGFRHF